MDSTTALALAFGVMCCSAVPVLLALAAVLWGNAIRLVGERKPGD